MVNQRHCPICKAPARSHCPHLALAVPGREFVQSCVNACLGHRQWQKLCRHVQEQRVRSGDWSPDKEDFMWLETAFVERFLKPLSWFAGMDHEWRTGPKLDQGGFWVLIWSKDPQRLWWELLDEFERQARDWRAILMQHAAAPQKSAGSFQRWF